MTVWNKVQGDVNDTIVVTLSGVGTLDAVDTVEAHVWRSGATAEDLATAVTDTANREVTVQLGGVAGWLSDAAAGSWLLEYEVTFLDGSVLTWPASSPDSIHVRAQGG